MARPLFAYPFHGGYGVSSPYGQRGGGFHTGTDFAVPTGTPILASNDGTVIYAAYEAGGAGNTITISGADGWQSRYHHLREWVVGVGQHVQRGQVVAYCDNTGASSGPHLHFEIRPTPSQHTDPVPILNADAAAAGGGAEEPFTMGQMEDIAQWHSDTRAVILNALIGQAWQGYPPPTNVLGTWMQQQTSNIVRALEDDLAELEADASGHPNITLDDLRARLLAAVSRAVAERGTLED